MKIYIGSDHAGYALKEAIKSHLQDQHEMIDFGSNNNTSVDYPDYALPVGEAVIRDPDAIGILICGSGIGMAIAANKVTGVRAALVYNQNVAHLAKEHDDANIICLGAREFSVAENLKFVDIFLASHFMGGHHQPRIDKIVAYEAKNH